MYFQTAISLAEIEVLDQEILNFRMIGDTSGAVADIAEALLAKIMAVQVMVQAVKRIITVAFIVGIDATIAVFATVVPVVHRTETHHFSGVFQ